MGSKRNLDALERRRFEAAKLLKKGLSQAEVARRLEVSRQSVSKWADRLEQAGKDGLRRHTLGRPSELADAQCAKLGKLLVAGALAQGFATELWTLPRVAQLIESRFGVRYSNGHIWHLLRRLGFSCQKPARRAIQRDETQIEHWKKRRWPTLKKTPPVADKPSSS
jgi:transposase